MGEAPRTAEGPPDLSTARQGRQLGAAPIGGWDRCDAASPEAGSEACREALERRLGEYAKPGSAPVTPEARLLILSNPPGAPASVSSATRRLGAPEAPPVDALAGSAAGDLAAALATRGQPDAPAAPTGVPSVVVTTPR